MSEPKIGNIHPPAEEELTAEQAQQAQGGALSIEDPTSSESATGGAGAGKIKFNEFTIKKTSDLG
jgi:hypothetical protein